MSIAPAGRDNHVMVDPATGLVYCTIDDQQSLYSGRGEILFTFDPDGLDLTEAPPPMVGGHYPGIDMNNPNGTMAIAVWDGRVHASQFKKAVNFSFLNHVTCESPGGTTWVTSFFPGQPGPNGFQDMAVDDGHVVLAGPVMAVFDTDGWFVWQTDQAGGCLSLFNGIIYTARDAEIRRFQSTDGTTLAPFPGPTMPSAKLTLDENNIYWAEMISGSLHVSARALDGGIVYDYVAPVGPSYDVRAIAADMNGRAWIVLNSYEEGMSDLVVRVEVDGTLSQHYHYGYRINDVASDGDRMYLTGQLDQNTTETFLIAVDVSMPTTMEEREATGTRIWPNPSKDHLWLSDPENWTFAQILDARGRMITSNTIKGAATIDVGHLEAGLYNLRLMNEREVITRPIIIAR